MRKILFGILAICSLSLGSCIKEEVKSYVGPSVVEFDAAGKNSATTPFSYRVLTRVPLFGRAENSTLDTLIRRTMSVPAVKLRINLVGPQMTTAQVIAYKVLTSVTPPGTGQLAVSGTHFTTSGTCTIPANSSYGEVVINVLNTGTTSTIVREVHIELEGNTVLKPSENYKTIAIRISQL